MDPIHALRERAALTQQSLARAGGTSQPTIAAYEAGRKSPTVHTLQRLGGAVGLHATIEYSTPLTRESAKRLAALGRTQRELKPVLRRRSTSR